jgi:hypothetical protein
VINSERVTIETRDRFRNGEIVSSRILVRHIDYEIDYELGTLFFKEPGYIYYDLGEQWKELTGLGFIFACWASKRPLEPLETAQLAASKSRGFSPEDPLLLALPKHKREVVVSYLTNNIVYEATPEMMKGFEIFRAAVTDLEMDETATLVQREDTQAFYAYFEV